MSIEFQVIIFFLLNTNNKKLHREFNNIIIHIIIEIDCEFNKQEKNNFSILFIIEDKLL